MLTNNLRLYIKPAFVMLLVIFVSGCVANKPKSNNYQNSNSSPVHKVEQQLLGYYSDWEGTPYRYGGNSRDGIDCSAFVKNAYQSVFEIKVPRTTLGQAELGKKVSKSELLPGDLVLFKTSRRVRHVGVVVSANQFMHVSEKKGVIISALDNVYWRKKYWKAVRPDNGLQL
jgi:probable lipoprotein NlpC